MRNKPLYLKIFPFLALMIAASFPLQIFMIYDIPLIDIERIFSMLTPLNILTMATMIVTAILTFAMNRNVYRIIPALLLVTFTNNAIVGLYGSDYTLFQVAMSFILFGLSLKPFYSREIRAVITEPRLRWWNTPKRYDVRKQIKIHSEKFDVSSETINLSRTGMFAKVKEGHHLDQFDINEVINLEIMDEHPISLRARIVRKTQGNEMQPDGFGLEIIKDEFHKKDYLPWFREATA